MFIIALAAFEMHIIVLEDFLKVDICWMDDKIE